MRSSFVMPILLLLLLFLGSCNSENRKPQAPEQNATQQDELAVLNDRIQQDSLDASLFKQRAEVYLDRKQINPALSDLGRAIELEPERSDLYITLADAYLSMGKLPNCLEALQKAEKLDPENNEALLKLAEVYLVLQDYDNVYHYIQKSLELDTKNPKEYFIRGYALMEVGDTAAAVRNIQNALDQDQQYYEAAVQLGILYSAKQNPLAEQYLKSAIRIDPNRSAAYYLLGLYYQDVESFAEAVDTYNKLIVIDPGFKEAYYNIGYINLVHYQDFKKAADFFTQAIQQDPGYLDAWFNRGYSEELDGDYPSARRDYKKALDIQANYDRAIEGLNRLDRMGK